MKFVLAVHGTRGDVEPCAAVGLELMRRGHEVHMAVAPNMAGFVESTGLEAVAYGPDSQEQIRAAAGFAGNVLKIQRPRNVVRAAKELFAEGWEEMSRTLTDTYPGVAANVAEYYDIPLVALHYFPVRVNGQLGLPSIPSMPPVVRFTMRRIWWLYSWITKEVEDAQRRELGLPRAASSAGQRMLEQKCLEIQAYDEACFPGLSAEWAAPRPFVGALTMELATENDEEVASWCAAGTPPIYFSFGSTPVLSPADMVDMISAACMELGERALINCATTDADDVAQPDHVKLVGPVNYSVILPACRAVVHHGGAAPSGYADVDPLGRSRSAPLGRTGEATQSRYGTAFLEHQPPDVGCGSPYCSRAAICDQSPRNRHPDEETRCRRCCRRRSLGARGGRRLNALTASIGPRG